MEVSTLRLFWLLSIRKLRTNSRKFIKLVWLHIMTMIKPIGKRERKVPSMQLIKILKMSNKENKLWTKNLKLKKLLIKKHFSCLEQFQVVLVHLVLQTQKVMSYGEWPVSENIARITWEFWEIRVSLVNNSIMILLLTTKINNCTLNLRLITIL